MGSRSHNHCQIFAACHLCRLAQDYYKHRPRTSLTLLDVKIIATNANNNVDVTASLNLNIHTLYFSHDVNYSHEYVTFWYVWNVRTTIFEILILDVFKNSHVFVTSVKNSFTSVTDSFECESQTNLSQMCTTRHWGEPNRQVSFESPSSFWGDAITRKIKDGRRRLCFSTDRIFYLVLAQLDIEGNILTKI